METKSRALGFFCLFFSMWNWGYLMYYLNLWVHVVFTPHSAASSNGNLRTKEGQSGPAAVWVTPPHAHRTAGSGSGQNEHARGTCPLQRVKETEREAGISQGRILSHFLFPSLLSQLCSPNVKLH